MNVWIVEQLKRVDDGKKRRENGMLVLVRNLFSTSAFLHDREDKLPVRGVACPSAVGQ